MKNTLILLVAALALVEGSRIRLLRVEQQLPKEVTKTAKRPAALNPSLNRRSLFDEDFQA